MRSAFSYAFARVTVSGLVLRFRAAGSTELYGSCHESTVLTLTFRRNRSLQTSVGKLRSVPPTLRRVRDTTVD